MIERLTPWHHRWCSLVINKTKETSWFALWQHAARASQAVAELHSAHTGEFVLSWWRLWFHLFRVLLTPNHPWQKYITEELLMDDSCSLTRRWGLFAYGCALHLQSPLGFFLWTRVHTTAEWKHRCHGLIWVPWWSQRYVFFIQTLRTLQGALQDWLQLHLGFTVEWRRRKVLYILIFLNLLWFCQCASNVHHVAQIIFIHSRWFFKTQSPDAFDWST